MSSFHILLDDYGKLSAWAAVSATAPFLGALSSVAPPSHPVAIATITAAAQLVVLALTYQLLNPPKKSIVNKAMTWSFAVLIFASLLYGTLFGFLTVKLLNSSERIVRGFVCTKIALHQFGDKCPLLGGLELNEIRNRPDALWTDGSITAAHVILIAAWLAVFMAFAVLIGSFVVYQRRPITRRSPMQLR
jgi:hypothetical protein